jgi:hypothetical protein
MLKGINSIENTKPNPLPKSQPFCLVFLPPYALDIAMLIIIIVCVTLDIEASDIEENDSIKAYTNIISKDITKQITSDLSIIMDVLPTPSLSFAFVEYTFFIKLFLSFMYLPP